MTKEQEIRLEFLKEMEYITSSNYWEHFKSHKDLAQCFGANHYRTKQMGESCEKVRLYWQEQQNEIEEFIKAANV